MNIQHLRHSLQEKWLAYYCENREWIVQLSIWVTCEGEHRPSASFILAALTVLDPQLTRLMPLLSGLNSNPDRIVLALGLNFNPEERAERWLRQKKRSSKVNVLSSTEGQIVDVSSHSESPLGNRALPLSQPSDAIAPQNLQHIARQDEQCAGRDRHDPDNLWR